MDRIITHVNLGERSYDIVLTDTFTGLGSAVAALGRFSNVAIITDSTVGPTYAPMVQAELSTVGVLAEIITFPAGESSKNFETTMELHSELIRMKIDRKGLIVALGGGVCGDMAGFVAATYMRGIPFIQIPTTMLSLVDSSVGGKTGINHPLGKNMIGSFHQPSLVWGNLATLRSLPIEELSSGLAEVVKHGVIRDSAYFAMVEKSAARLMALEFTALADAVAGSCRIKAAVVGADEREGGLRAILNFGHTAAHAFESLTDYIGYRHGAAVAIGMMVACRLAERMTGFLSADTARVERLLLSLGLPTRFRNLATDDIVQSMFGDKKTERGTLRYVLPSAIGAADIVPVTDLSALRNAIDATRES